MTPALICKLCGGPKVYDLAEDLCLRHALAKVADLVEQELFDSARRILRHADYEIKQQESDAKPILCEWQLFCSTEATGTEVHPLLGEVPICGACRRTFVSV